MPARLITIPFSHYCEKARWALDRAAIDYREEGHLPMLHWLPARRAGGGRTVPVLVADGEVIADSTDILRWVDRRTSTGLIPDSAAQRAEVDRLEDWFDGTLGPHSRRWAYFQVFTDPALTLQMTGFDVPAWEKHTLRVARPLAVAAMRRLLRIDRVHADRSRARVDEVFAGVADLLADGRRYLVGGGFTAADLTFASLAVPSLMPAELPVPFPPLSTFPAETRDTIEAWRAHPAGRFALRLYADERAAVPARSAGGRGSRSSAG
jgi:glutathione S-transferase